MKKRILGVIVVLTMLMALLVVPVNADTSGTCGANLTWTLDASGTLTISGTGDMTDYYTWGNKSPWDNNLNIKNIVIDNGVTSIGNYAFYYCQYLESVSIPNSVKSIGDYAFHYCWKNFMTVNIPGSVTRIGEDAFSNCSTLTNINISNGVTEIADSAFYGVLNVTAITIPESVTKIGDSVFLGCVMLQNINVAANNPNYCSVNGVLFTKDMKTILVYPPCKSLLSYSIPASVTTIGKQAFDGSDVSTIIIPDGVTSI